MTLERDRLRASLQESEQLMRKQAAQSESLSKQNSELAQKLQALESTGTDKLNHLTRLLDESKRVQSLEFETNRKLQESESSLKSKIEALQRDLVSRDQQIIDLKTSINSLSSTSKGDNSAATQQIKELNERIDDISSQIQSKDEVIRTLNAESEKLQTSIKTQTDAFNQQQAALHQAQQSHDNLLKKYKNFEQEKNSLIQDLNRQISSLADENFSATLNSQKAQSQVSEENANLKTQLQKEHEEHKKQLQKLQHEVDARNLHANQLDSDLSQKNEENKVLSSRVEDLGRKLQNSEASQKGAMEEIKALHLKVSELSASCESSSNRVKQLQDQNNNFQTQLNDLESQLSNERANVAVKSEEALKLNSELEASKAVNADLSQKLDDLVC